MRKAYIMDSGVCIEESNTPDTVLLRFLEDSITLTEADFNEICKKLINSFLDTDD